MGITRIQNNQAQYNSSSSARTCAYPSNVTAGSLLVAFIGTFGTSITVSLADTLSQTWVHAGAYVVQGDLKISLWYVANSLAGANTLTVTPSAASDISIQLVEYGGVLATSPLDTVTTSSGVGVSTPFVGFSGTLGDLIVAGMAQGTAALSFVTVDYPFQLVGNLLSVPPVGMESADAITSSGVLANVARFTAPQGVDFTAISASFKAPPPLGTLPLVPKVPNDDHRLRRFTDQVSAILNSLFRRGQLVQSGPQDFQLKV